jgi:8-oxo-dGTP pyrophosphatase MutT (NUDIX family)
MSQPTEPIPQAAVVAVSGGRVCLVTSSSGRRWTLPKGTIEPAQTAVECAGQEVWEEAGLGGHIDPSPISRYEGDKYGRPTSVQVFTMRVSQTARTWPERGMRSRRWFTPADAVEALTIPGQREAVRLALATVLMAHEPG